MSTLKKPNNVEAERELLTACFKSENPNFTAQEVMTLVTTETVPEMYSHPHYEKIFLAMQEAVHDSGGGEINWGDVRGYIVQGSEARTTLREMMGAGKLPPITKTRCEKMVKKLSEAHQSRRVLELVHDVQKRALANDSAGAYALAMDGIFALGRDRHSSGAKPMSDYIDATKAEVTYRRNAQGIVGIKTGLAPIDNILSGLQRKHLIYIGARPGNYKSVAIGQIAYNVAMGGYRALIGSPEMSGEQYIMRLACKIVSMDFDLYNKGKYSEAQEDKIHQALEALRHDNIIINESGAQDTTSLRKDIIRFRPDVVLVDYAQLFEPTNPTGNEFRDVSRFSRELNTMKKDFNVPVVSALQLSRKVEERDDKRPIASDLRATGQLEQDADAIMMLYSPRNYAKQDEAGIWWKGKEEIDPTELHWVCAKNRHGKREDTVTYVKEGELWVRNEQDWG